MLTLLRLNDGCGCFRSNLPLPGALSVQSDEHNIGYVLKSRSFEGSIELTIAASWESAPSRSVGCVQPEERNIGYVLKSRSFEGSIELTIAVS